jgi:undecaprenyl-phosphate 4-deoxy-4-formamido-L-arabinose transferase
VAAFGLGFGLFRIVQKLLGADITMGYTSLFSAVVILGGLQLIALSVIGEYIGRIFIQIQGRPLYNVAEEIGFAETADESARPSGDVARALKSQGTDG